MIFRLAPLPSLPLLTEAQREEPKGSYTLRSRSYEGPHCSEQRRRAPPGTLEVNVLRMVGRCLVCSRLISTWVSSLEPPPSTPSTPFSPPPPLPPPLAPALSPPGRVVSTTSSGYTSLARRSKFTSVSYVSPRPITDSSFSSRSRGSLGRPALCFLLPLLPVGAHTPPVRHPTSLAFPHFRVSLSPLVEPWRSALFGPVYPTSLSLAKSRDSAVSSPLSHRERATLLLLLLLFLSFRLRRARPPPFSSDFVSRGVGWKIIHPTCLDSPLLRLSSLSSGNGSAFNPLARPLDDTSSSERESFRWNGKKRRAARRDETSLSVGRNSHTSLGESSRRLGGERQGQAFRVNRLKATMWKQWPLPAVLLSR